ncbi:hypothetical protein GE061_000365 [Apolygus lucorum]|uniref:G-protein coupled receptors family 2 profile 2 domain-containing protein n=1 Tax=Apolygus lucorum TaxID=248454 RepID=A0A6A4K4G4_APOLU|nr:hypothetical protein GE061_000365 [Apolygus lucorum]
MRIERKKMRLLVMLAMVTAQSTGLSISHWDLEGANKTCDWKATCHEDARTPKSSKAALREVDWRDRNCMCDPLCGEYGDCCPDSVHFEVSEQRRGTASYKCVELRNFGGIYMSYTCPPRWGDMDVRRGCELASVSTKDPMAGVPVSSNTTGITYRNLYCAMCHDDHYDLHVWHPRLECSAFPLQLPPTNFSKLLEFNGTNWGVTLDDRFYPCTIDPVVPESAMSFIRRCQPNVIRTCAINWTNIEVRSRCEAYTSLVYLGDKIYRNPHCAVCNNDPLQYLSCSPTLFRNNFPKEFSLVAFSVLFDLSGGQVGLTTLCGDHQLFDPFFKRCRSIITELNSTKENYRITNEGTMLDFVPVDHESEVGKRENNCTVILLEKGEFELENGTMWVSQYKKRFEPDEFELNDDGRVKICAGDLEVKLINKFGIYMGYVTYAGLGISIIFLVLHLTAFALVEELRNLSGKNLASLCVALLVAYTAFMAGLVLDGTTCAVDGVITFYAFLASFFWTSTMSFDVWRTLRLATAELRVSSGRQWRKFFVYSIWSWCAPAVVVSGALWVEFTPSNIDDSWRPAFGDYTCWFGHPKPLLAFFASPMAIIMTFNIIFFVSSARMIYSTTSTTKFTASATTQRDFRLYVRLSVVMGLAWTTGLIAATFNIEILWYVFIGLNTLQGLFIFLAFTCNDKVIRGLAVRRADDKPLRPPSFSWSTDSTARRSTTDTLY